MAITQVQQEAAKAAMDRHLKACPVCRNDKFLLGPDVTFLPTIVGKRVNLGHGQPCLTAVCQNCGSVQLFNVYALGLADVFGLKPAEPGKSDG